MNTMNMAQLTIELDKIQRQIAAIQRYVMSLRGYQTIPNSVPHSNSYVALRSVRQGAQSRMSRLNPNAAEFHSQLNVMVEPKEKEQKPKEQKPKKSKEQYLPLISLLLEGEEVILRVNTGKRYEDGYPQFTTATTRYEKGVFTVTACESVPSLIGQSSDKPGTLLYQFVRELLRAKIIFRSFNIAPWKLCFVKRNGQHQSLYQLYQEKIATA